MLSDYRPSEKKEDLKPLFNPEVDLASSVLQTLREVTDEEYQDALARDAAKSAARAAEDILIGDATPQESANIVTIVVKPLSDEDDVMPQASNIKQSRCIHPLQSTSKMRMAKKPNLFVYKPRLPKAKPPLLHHVFDNGIGASNVHESVVPFNEKAGVKSSDTSPLRVIDSPSMKSSASSNNPDDNCGEKDTDFRSVSEKTKLIDLHKSPLLDSIRSKINGVFARSPKRLENVLEENNRNSGNDLNPASSIINEQTAKKVPYLRTNSLLENIKQKKKPLSISNLLNLKDVEIIPAKELINKVESDKIGKPKLISPSIINNDDRPFDKDCDGSTISQVSQVVPQNNNIHDNVREPEESASNINEQVSSKTEQIDDDNCGESVSDTNTEGLTSNRNPEGNDSNFISTKVFDSPGDNTNELPKEASTENKDSIDNRNEDSMTDSSNYINDFIQKQEERSVENKGPTQDSVLKLLQNENRTPDEPCADKEKESSDFNENAIENKDKPKLKLLDTSLVDKTIANLKDNIAKKLEDLKNLKKDFINKDVTNRGTLDDDEDSGEAARNESLNLDCQDEASIQVTTLSPDTTEITSNDFEDVVTTAQPNILDESEDMSTFKTDLDNISEDVITLKPDSINDNSRDANEYANNAVSLQDLQKLSDSMLQQEDKDLINGEFNEYSSETTVDPLNNKNRDTDLDSSANTLANVTEEPVFDNLRDNNHEDGTCKSNLFSQNNLLSNQNDAHVDASEIVASSVPTSNGMLKSGATLETTLSLLKKPSPEVRDILKLPPLDPLPIIEDFKGKLSTLFGKKDRDIDEISTSESMTVSESSPAKESLPSSPDVSDIFKLPPLNPLPGLDNFKETLANLFNKNDRDVEEISTPELKTMLIPTARTKPIAEKINMLKLPPLDPLPGIDKVKTKLTNLVNKDDRDVEEISPSAALSEPVQTLLKKPLLGESDILKLPPLDPLPDIKDINVKLANLFDKKNRDIEKISTSIESKSVVQQDTVNPVMTSAASTSNFQSRMPFSRQFEDINSKRLKSKPQLSKLPEIKHIDLKSYKTKLPLPKDLSLNPVTMKSTLDTKSLHPLSSATKKNADLSGDKFNLRSRDKTTSIFNKQSNVKPRLGDIKNTLSDSPLEATRHFHSTLRKTQKALESRMKQSANKNFNSLNTPTKSSSSLLDSLARNHEDISDKLKGLQMDLNDRLETMRNDLIDRSKLRSSGPRTNKHAFSNTGKPKKDKRPLKYTWQSPTTRESQKMTVPRKPIQQKPIKITPPSKANKQSTFRMPGAASVPVPSTIEVPQLKTASENATPINLKQSSLVSSWNGDKLKMKEKPNPAVVESNNLRNTNSILRKPFTRTDSKIIVSFSTTPRPEMINKYRTLSPYQEKSNIDMSQEDFRPRFTDEDFDGSPSEVKKTKASAPFFDHVNKHKYMKMVHETESPTRESVEPEEIKLNAPDTGDFSTKNAIQSWPKATESSFLTKVREAVQTRLSNVNSPKHLKQKSLQKYQDKVDKETTVVKSDMARSASENKEIIEPTPLKENVSYKCRMLCTKEK